MTEVQRKSHRDADTRYRRRKAADPLYLKKQSERAKEYYARTRETRLARRHEINLKHVYGISTERYQQIFADQGGLCAGCGRPETTVMKSGRVKTLHTDHDHKTGQVRGLLCRNCNLVLGHAKDNPEILSALLEYLRRWAN